jgi:cytochrome c biogenesis protein CcmG, thiol:disulfide interchange protein DsbE
VSTRATAAFIGVLALIGLLGYGLTSKGAAKITVGEPAPDKELPYLERGGTGRLRDYRGEWLLANLWASWCKPCEDEAPVLERYWRRNRRSGLTLLGINVQDNSADARAFVKRFRLTYPQLRSVADDRSRAFGSTGVPESFLIDPRGRLALIRRGVVDQQYLNRFVTPLIGDHR